MHIFHSRENIKTSIFTAVKIQDLIFSRERNRKIGTIFSIFSIWFMGSNSLWHICFFSKGRQLLVFPISKKSESLRRLIKERAFINSSATTRKSKQKLLM